MCRVTFPSNGVVQLSLWIEAGLVSVVRSPSIIVIVGVDFGSFVHFLDCVDEISDCIWVLCMSSALFRCFTPPRRVADLDLFLFRSPSIGSLLGLPSTGWFLVFGSSASAPVRSAVSCLSRGRPSFFAKHGGLGDSRFIFLCQSWVAATGFYRSFIFCWLGFLLFAGVVLGILKVLLAFRGGSPARMLDRAFFASSSVYSGGGLVFL